VKGRKPKDPNLKKAEGNLGKRAILTPVETSEPSGMDLSPPEDLRFEAAEVWKRVVPELRAWDKLSPVDRELLAGFCNLMARHYELEKTLEKTGPTYVSGNGLVKERPEVKLSAQALNNARLIGESFGFSPQARQRLGTVETADDDDPIDRI
jgi:P27 family predicted phage terminase small subunit